MPTSGGGSSGGASADGPTSWHRVDLGFVSAYVLARGGEAAVVDTGVPGNEGAILEALEAAGLGWSDVGHVILTHRHQDHVGSAPAVLDAAPGAAAYAGAADIPAIDVPRALVPAVRSVTDESTSSGVPPRSTRVTIVRPTRSADSRSSRSSGDDTGCPSNAINTSPTIIPAASAGPPGVSPTTSRPRARSVPPRCRSVSSTGWPAIPR